MESTDWDARHRDTDRFSDREPNRFVVDVVKRLKPGTALDLASGQGRNAVWLAEQGWQVTAIDYSAVAVEKAAAFSAQLGLEITFRQADLLEWQPDDRYDLVMIVYLQVPLPDRHEVWRKAARAVADGGHLLLVGHDLRNLEEGYGGPSHPSVLYTASEAAGVAGEALRIERSETVLRPVETGEGARFAIDNLVLARRT
ncbi:MAG: class I SAM-dependent methyltransferase [Actinobacteria bacterium]|nr:class I SAM-dependent methyltransferase [Actinomycetota bacterium]